MFVESKLHPDLFLVSLYGEVKSKRTGRILKQTKKENGYLQINTRKEGKQIKPLVHTLIALTFVPNPDNKAEVNHLDGDKSNNSADNLEWCTREENMQHASKEGLLNCKGSNNNNSKLSEQDVINIRRLYAEGNIMKDIAKAYNISKPHVSDIVNHKKWKHIN